MSHPELEELERAEQFFNEGKLDEALELFNDWSQFEGLTSQQKGYYQFLKGLILIHQYKSEDLIKLGEDIFKEGQKLNENLQSVDGYFFIVVALCQTYKFNEALIIVEKAEALLRSNSNVSKSTLFQKETRISLVKALVNLEIGNIDLAEKCLEGILGSEKELNNTFEIVWANIIMARIMYQGKREFDLALNYTEKALSLAKQIKFNHFWIGFCELAFGVRHLAICEFNSSLKQHLKSLVIFRKIKNNWFIATTLNNIAILYNAIGDYDLALKYYQESMLLFETQSMHVELPLCNLIKTALNKNDIELAQKYFNRLENLHIQKKESFSDLNYPLTKALMLKKSSRIRDIAKAEELLKQVTETETIWFDITTTANINLCDLLLAEFRVNNNSEVLDEINQCISRLLTIAEKQHSYQVFCETFILQAKLALINFNVKAARRFLTQAQKIVESYGIKELAKKISHEHDELLKQIKLWENLKESEASLTERWKLAGLNEQIENMVRKRMAELPDPSDEESVLLLIVSEGGIPFFSHSFVEDKSFESHLFGGFLTTIDYFIKETFSEGLDRAIFGDYTLLMKSIPPFFVSYIFKGDSYYALQKLDYFIDHIQKKDEIWETLHTSFQANQTIQLNDVPLLDSLITEIFISKSIVSNQI